MGCGTISTASFKQRGAAPAGSNTRYRISSKLNARAEPGHFLFRRSDLRQGPNNQLTLATILCVG